MLPAVIVHADWGTNPKKRVSATARRLPDGRYRIKAPEIVGRSGSWRQRLNVPSDDSGACLIGFDFPIGVPRTYAARAGIRSFPEALANFGDGDWSSFYDVCATPAQISLRRPFFPNSCPVAGMCRQEHLTAALGLTWDELHRRCERKTAERRAACPLFWTLGGNQVGKGSIAGWRECVQPTVDEGGDIGLWPFDGALLALLESRSVVIVETYPTEFYAHLGFRLGGGKGNGKQSPSARQAVSKHLLTAAAQFGCEFTEAAHEAVTGGFGPRRDGEDPFDAMVGVLGILKCLHASEPIDAPADRAVQSVEGWILGQRPGQA